MCLNRRNYAQSICIDENFLLKTAFRMFTFEIDLTETGLLNYKEVIALVFEYLRKVKLEWLDNG